MIDKLRDQYEAFPYPPRDPAESALFSESGDGTGSGVMIGRVMIGRVMIMVGS